jgi:two-component system, cell cycle sensor histidine kinase and response regulator CckA
MPFLNKQVEKDLKRREFLLNETQHIAHLGSWELDVINNKLWWSDETYRLFGFQVDDETAFEKFINAIHPEDKNNVQSSIDLSIKTGSNLSMDYRIILPTGDIRYLHEESQSIIDDNSSKIVKRIGSVQDITERRASEEMVRKSKEEWEKTFDAISDIITIQDKEMRIVRANKATHQFFGSEYGELNGKHCYELFTGRSEPCLHCPMVETINNIEDHTEIIEHETLGKTFLVSSSAIKDGNGDLQHFVHTAKDITDHKAMEERLLQSQKMEAIGTLTGGIAHDFNNILAAIIGFAELIEQDVSPESQVGQDIKEIIISGRRGADLIKHLLAYSRETGKGKTIISPHLVAQEALRMLRATLPTSISIEEDIDSHCGTILANPTNLHQIIINLCNNASQSIPEMKGIMGIKLYRKELIAKDIPPELDLPTGAYIVLSISDTGCGMDEETKGRIFEPYFTTKEIGSGTGLGLSVVHGIVHDFRGFIEVDSTIGQGSTFVVYLPVSGKPADENTPHSDDQNIHPASGRNKRILIVDDDPLLCAIIERRLVHNGYHVTCFTDSEKALNTILGNPDNFDLIITDQTMPGLTGDDLAKAVLKVRPDIPIIMCTGHSETVPEEKALSLGVKKYIYKPIKNEELLVIVQELLEGK